MKARKFTLFPIIRQFVCFACDNNIVVYVHTLVARTRAQTPNECISMAATKNCQTASILTRSVLNGPRKYYSASAAGDGNGNNDGAIKSHRNDIKWQMCVCVRQLALFQHFQLRCKSICKCVYVMKWNLNLRVRKSGGNRIKKNDVKQRRWQATSSVCGARSTLSSTRRINKAA